MKNYIEELIRCYKLDVQAMSESVLSRETKFEISIDLGSNEGYYVNISKGCDAYHLRMHSKDEAVKTLGVMLCLLPNN